MHEQISAEEFFHEHLLAIMSSFLFICLFVVSVPIIYFMNLSPNGELFFFGLLFGACHLANWPMFRIRSALWFEGRLTPYAAMVTTALLAGTFGIPFILLVDMLQ